MLLYHIARLLRDRISRKIREFPRDAHKRYGNINKIDSILDSSRINISLNDESSANKQQAREHDSSSEQSRLVLPRNGNLDFPSAASYQAGASRCR